MPSLAWIIKMLAQIFGPVCCSDIFNHPTRHDALDHLIPHPESLLFHNPMALLYYLSPLPETTAAVSPKRRPGLAGPPDATQALSDPDVILSWIRSPHKYCY